MNEGKKVILFDGVCNLCNRAVQFIIKRDRQNQFLFGSLQGNAGQVYLKKFGIESFPLKSLLLIEDNSIHTASSAVLRICKYLGRGWQFFYAFIIIPKFIRDAVYLFIAKNRYKWFGIKDNCWVPGADQKTIFLD